MSHFCRISMDNITRFLWFVVELAPYTCPRPGHSGSNLYFGLWWYCVWHVLLQQMTYWAYDLLGWMGAGFNPARCLGPVAAYGKYQPYLWQQYWVFLIGPFSACLLCAFVYHIVPFDHSTLYKKRDSSIHVALRVLEHRKESMSGRSKSRSTRNTTDPGQP